MKSLDNKNVDYNGRWWVVSLDIESLLYRPGRVSIRSSRQDGIAGYFEYTNCKKECDKKNVECLAIQNN